MKDLDEEEIEDPSVMSNELNKTVNEHTHLQRSLCL